MGKNNRDSVITREGIIWKNVREDPSEPDVSELSLTYLEYIAPAPLKKCPTAPKNSEKCYFANDRVKVVGPTDQSHVLIFARGKHYKKPVAELPLRAASAVRISVTVPVRGAGFYKAQRGAELRCYKVEFEGFEIWIDKAYSDNNSSSSSSNNSNYNNVEEEEDNETPGNGGNNMGEMGNLVEFPNVPNFPVGGNAGNAGSLAGSLNDTQCFYGGASVAPAAQQVQQQVQQQMPLPGVGGQGCLVQSQIGVDNPVMVMVPLWVFDQYNKRQLNALSTLPEGPQDLCCCYYLPELPEPIRANVLLPFAH